MIENTLTVDLMLLYCIVFIGRCTCNYIQNGTSSTLKVEARLHPKRLYQPLYLEFRNSKDGGVGGRRCPPSGGGENSFYPNSLGQFYPDKQDPRAKAKWLWPFELGNGYLKFCPHL